MGVTRFAVGDRVGIGWQGRCCQECEWCLCGEVHLCVDIVARGTWTPHGGFSSSVTVDERFHVSAPRNDAVRRGGCIDVCRGDGVRAAAPTR